LISVLVVLGACSSDSKKSTTTTAGLPAATTVATAAGDSTATTEAGAAASTVASQPAESTPASEVDGSASGDACAIAGPDDVAAAFGGTVAPGAANPDDGGCDFDITGTTKTGDVDVFAQVSIQYGQTDYIGVAEEKAVVPEVTEVPGVGDEAWYLEISLTHQLHISVNGTELLIYAVLPGDAATIKAELIDFATMVVANL